LTGMTTETVGVASMPTSCPTRDALHEALRGPIG
jgi:hypothetical protein